MAAQEYYDSFNSPVASSSAGRHDAPPPYRPVAPASPYTNHSPDGKPIPDEFYDQGLQVVDGPQYQQNPQQAYSSPQRPQSSRPQQPYQQQAPPQRPHNTRPPQPYQQQAPAQPPRPYPPPGVNSHPPPRNPYIPPNCSSSNGLPYPPSNLQPQRTHSEPPRQQHRQDSYERRESYKRRDPKDGREHRHYSHSHTRRRSRSRSRERTSRHASDRPTGKSSSSGSGSKKHDTRNTFLGAFGGATIGDLIFPGLGTLGGAILGGMGGHEHSKKTSRPRKKTYDEEWDEGRRRRRET